MKSPQPSAPRSAIAGWVLFDWAAQPYFTLVTTFVFAPYFASVVANDPVRGQVLWGYATACAGIVIAFCSPVLGAIADAAGRRKPWIAGFGAVLVVASSLLWFGKPRDPAAVPLVLAAFALGTIAVEFATVFNNAMMPNLVPAEKIGSLSGTGWAIGYVGGMISLVITLGLLAADPASGKTLLGLKPLFGLDAATHQGDRASGPLSALWFLIFVTPLFLFTPDHPGRMRIMPAIRSGLATLADTLRRLPQRRDTALFLLANMIYADGLVALFAFGGIYAAGTFGWQTIEIGIFGILLTITGTIGAFVGGKLDDRFGPKPVILAALALLTIGGTAVLSIGRDVIFFVIPVAPRAADAGLYGSAAEKAYVAVGLLLGIAAGPLQAASRTLLVRLAPPERVTQHFGLLALSGKVTSFFGPLLVALVTGLFASQKAGMAVLIVFFMIGAALLMQVRVPRSSSPSP